MRALCIVLLLASCLAPAAGAQEVREKTPPPAQPTPSGAPTDPGPLHSTQRIRGSVITGEMAPHFELPGSGGRIVKLSEFRGEWTLLVFAERKEGMPPLMSIRDDMGRMGVRIVGVCDEKAYHLVAFAEKTRPGFPILADVTGEISALYGLYDSFRRTTEPGFFLLDREGKVRMALLGQQVRPADMKSLVRYAVEGM
jgi:peroxiredoxin